MKFQGLNPRIPKLCNYETLITKEFLFLFLKNLVGEKTLDKLNLNPEMKKQLDERKENSSYKKLSVSKEELNSSPSTKKKNSTANNSTRNSPASRNKKKKKKVKS